MVASREISAARRSCFAEQQRLDTPVARFSSAHDNFAPGVTAFAPQLHSAHRAARWRAYAFEVDLDVHGCKACVAACTRSMGSTTPRHGATSACS